METTAEASDKLLLENITERVESTHESYQSTSFESGLIEESRTVVFQSTQETITTVGQPIETNNSYFEAANDSIMAENNYKDDVNIGNTFSQSISEGNLIENVIENDPDLNLVTENEPDANRGINEKMDIGEGTDVLNDDQRGIPVSEDSKINEYSNDYIMQQQESENVYMPEEQERATDLVPDQAYATEMISDDSRDNTTEEEQALSDVIRTEEEPVITHTEVNLVTNPEQQEMHIGDQNNAEQDFLKDEVTNDIEAKTENNAEDVGDVNFGMEELTHAVQKNDICEEPNIGKDELNVQQSENENQSHTDNVEMLSTSQVTEMEEIPEETLNTSSDLVNLSNEDQTTPENVALQNYALPEGLEVTEINDEEYQQDSDGTLVLLQHYEQTETFENVSEVDNLPAVSDEQYMNELRTEAESRQSTSSTALENKPRRGRKPTFEIPMHVLGHDISKPMEPVSNGRSVPKPRLGVKVPYRNLTSQIVSKAEIEKEIMERARLKQEQTRAKGDTVFTRKLTQRLARKIAPSPNHPKTVLSPLKSKESTKLKKNVDRLTDPLAIDSSEVSESQEEAHKINNDSDLLAILEGEGDDMPVLPKEVPQPIQDDAELKVLSLLKIMAGTKQKKNVEPVTDPLALDPNEMLEREIALQQLQELPHLEPTPRVFRGRPVLVPESPMKARSAEKPSSSTKPTAAPTQASKKVEPVPQATSSDKENTSKHTKEVASPSPKRESKIDLPSSPKKGIPDEPQVKVNMVLKTYSRKRKTVELLEAFPESPSPKKPMFNDPEAKLDKSDGAGDVYVTKSSRVIKKKVIWDPDEIPARSPKSFKGDSPKIAKHPEKAVEKKTSVEKTTKEKSPEKKPSEKPTPKKAEKTREIEKTASPVEKKIPKTDSPKHSKSPLKNKKSLSEVDKLLMDEGAVKMLYDLKNTDEHATRKKKDVYSVERAHKEIMKKANEIKNDLQQNTASESPKSLRKKAEGFPPSLLKPALIGNLGERKMSKDSTRSSLHTPPGSPAYSQSSMLVRRRSSSSISSSDDVNTDDNVRSARRKSGSDVPKPKKMKKTEEAQESDEIKTVSQPKTAVVDPKPNQFNSFTVKKTNKHVRIDLNYTNANCYCTAEVLDELTVALKKYAREKDCNVVSITSSSKAFFSGLDYASLVSEKEDVRRDKATELAGKVRDFLLCLLTFPKVLVAGIKGQCVGLGVTMLPLFDMVIASDTATFSTPYASLGCVAEAGFLLSSPHLTNHGLAAELLFTTQKLKADDVFRRGLISRLCWPEKYNETLKSIIISISKGSKQSLEATKKRLRRHLIQSTEAAINAESKLLVEHWTSAECQKNFARLYEAASN